ncbi:hypothetical protein, partial [Chamaesiphon polymorphus]
MKQMMTTSAGVFLAISIISVIFGGFAFAEKSKFENELNQRDPLTKEINKQSGWDDNINKQKLEQLQGGLNAALVVAGGSGAIAVALAIVGKDR